jgi:predicted extracellular nuclease
VITFSPMRLPLRGSVAPTVLATAIASAGLVTLTSVAPAAAAAFTEGDVVVLRVGDGTAVASGAAAPVFLDEYSPAGALVQSVPLPTSTAGADRRLTTTASATSEGTLNRSADGRYLTLGGYDAAPGTAGVVSTTAAVTNRVVARVSADGVVDTSTALGDAYSSANIRGVTTDDGSRYWTAGSAGGVRFATHGAATSASITGTAPGNVRAVGIAGGQLYAGSASSPFAGVSSVGTGLPTAAATATLQIPSAATSPYGFVLLDRDAGVPGDDTAYVADDVAATGGLFKYSKAADGTWTARGSVAGAVRGLTGSVLGDGTARLYATNASGNALLTYQDTAAFDAPIAATATTVAPAGAQTVFRGVAFAPTGATAAGPAITTEPADATVDTGGTATLAVAATGTAPLSYQWYEGPAGTTTTPVGTDAPSFTTPALTASTSYWVRVTNALGSADSRTATVTVQAPPEPCTVAPTHTIPGIQGSGATAAVTGPVTVRGVVVGDYEGPSPALRGFYLQDPAGDGNAATSDGIFVFEGNADAVSNGQLVEVSGSATEFQDQTQISATSVAACPGTAPAVAPTDVTLPVASATALEAYEGMLVRFHQTLSVTEHFQLGRFGQVVVSSGGRLQQPTSLYPAADPRSAQLAAANALNRLIVDDATQAQNPDPIVFGRGGQPLSASNTLRGGDTLTDPVGVLTYTWAGNVASGNAYRLRPVGALGGSAQFVAANPRPAAAPAVGTSGPNGIKVASANLLNYFNTFTGCTFGVGGEPTGCRGAENATEFERQVPKEVAAITSLGADVVGVMEMENDGYGPDSAIADLTNRLNAATAPGTWAYIDADAALGVVNVAGDDAIKVGLLYRPGRVTPVPGTTNVDQAPDVFERHPLAQAFTTADGQKVSVVVNHFKSKICDGATGGDLDAGDGQGCFNARRTQQAQRLASWIGSTVVPAAGDPDVLVIGDLNSNAKEDPILALEAAGYVNLVEAYGGPNAYSYVFDGLWGYLDHALASPSLRPQVTGAGDYHINADEPSVLDYNTNFKTPGQIASLYAPDVFRTSDHDPVLVGLNLAKSASTTTVTSSANPSTVGQPVTFTATVAASRPGLTPTGTVRFYVAGVPVSGAIALTPQGGTAVATSPALNLPPAQVAVEARYSGDAAVAASTGRVTQRVQYGFPPLISPADGATVRAGSTVPVRFRLTDAAGRPLPDAAAALLAGLCQVRVTVTGAQTLAPACARYDAATDRFTYDWRTSRTGLGAAQLTVRVTIAGGEPQTRTVNLTLAR